MGNADIGAALAGIVEEASAVIMPFWRGAFVLERKADFSPVTEADHAGEKLIVDRLKALFPDIPVIAEESSALYGVPEAIGPRFFLVDPVDGTKAFVRGDTHFTVNIGLIEDGIPVAGAVAAPAQARTWFTAPDGCRRRAFGDQAGERVTVRPWPAEPVCLISHTMGPAEAEALKLQYGSSHTLAMDSSIKLCMIADGTADIYPRHGPTMEWDIAAAHAVLAAAGGTVTQPDGAPFLYGKADQGFRNGWFVARGGN
ncbi:MAG: 3'(2'),5'-bisphosphate nucleotidase CysQ [Caulobacteraceae bacterium]